MVGETEATVSIELTAFKFTGGGNTDNNCSSAVPKYIPVLLSPECQAGSKDALFTNN